MYTIERPEALEEIKIYPLDEPGVIAGIKKEDVEAIWRNHLKLFKYGITNETTLEVINNEAKEKQKLIDKEVVKRAIIDE